jgi:hypothetical protein
MRANATILASGIISDCNLTLFLHSIFNSVIEYLAICGSCV